MKLTKSLLLASVAGFAAVASAQAADLPSKKAAPVEYVKVCPTYGPGFFYIPGTTTCLKIGGQVTSDFRWGGGSREMTARTDQGYNNRTRGYVRLDARDNTEYGLLRTYASIYYEKSIGAAQSSSGTIEADQAYIQFGGLTAGRYTNLLGQDEYGFGSVSTVGGYKTVTLGVNAPTHGAMYAFNLGNGVTFAAGFEDSDNTRMNPTFSGAQAGQTAPDFTARIKVSQAWGDAWIGGASHQLRSDNSVVSTEYGYGVAGGVKVNLPMLAKGSNFGVMAAYADGAIAYAGNSVFGTSTSAIGTQQIGGTRFRPVDFQTDNPNQTSKSYYVGGHFTHFFTPTVSGHLFSAYMNYDPFGASNSTNIMSVGARLAWSPVSGLTLSPEVYYAKISTTNAAAANSGVAINTYGKGSDEVAVRMRIARSF
jgi:hypothetical protein